MRFITHCPNCETEFFVSDEQLSKHSGKVRCGHCLHVFDAKGNEIDSSESEEENGPTELESDDSNTTENSESVVDDSPVDEIISGKSTDLILSEPEDLTDHPIFNKKSKLRKVPTWLLTLFVLILLSVATAQSIYFLRTKIATYYPISKPFLIKACKAFKCTVDLPQNIELIAIDDSDIQEDADYKSLMRFSSTLINQASFNQQFPNVELTLTDVDDKPQLRRIFKPSEYLPSDINISAGLNPGQEIKIKLAITAGDNVVAGYRVFVTY